MKRSLLFACLGAAPWLVLVITEQFVRTTFPDWVWIGLYWGASPILAITAIVLAVGENRRSPGWQPGLAIGIAVVTLMAWAYGLWVMVMLMLYL